jgi:asparagine synthase (glutamine-hydrolysing)
MAMRRLSIIDLAGGHQPMSNEDGTIHIVYNGEVYNYKDLRIELARQGHSFSTKCDAEVVLHGYEQWGCQGLLKRLRGMYAFAIWNNVKQSLFLARDRMGMKPLYFTEREGRLYFASEIRGLLLHANMPRQFNVLALAAFMKVGFVTAPYTLFEGIRKLLPAHYLFVKAGKMTIHKYWELSFEARRGHSEAAVVEEFLALLDESVRIHLMSEVPVGALLSGGVDSTTNVALMRRVLQEPFKTVTVGFQPRDYDEVEQAAASARALGTEHYSILFSDHAMDEYPKIIFFQEEPAARATFAALYYLFQACRRNGLKVVLTGEGADELLGGYSWHSKEYLPGFLSRLPDPVRSMLTTAPMSPVRSMLATAPMSRLLWGARRQLGRILRGKRFEIHEKYEALNRIGEGDSGLNLLSSEVKAELIAINSDPVLEFWANWSPCVVKQPYFQQLLWIQSRTRLVDYINHNLDRMSMAHSIEARPPFLDHKLWEFCATIPPDLMLRGSPPNQTEKYLLREAGRNLVPEPARLRKKKPLRVPYEAWLSQKYLPEWAENALSERQLRKTGLFDPEATLQSRQDFMAGALNKATLLMGVLAVQAWADIFLQSPLNREPPTP